MEFTGFPPLRERSCTADACAHVRSHVIDQCDSLTKQSAVLVTIGRHLLEPAGQRSMLRGLLDDLIRGLGARGGVIRMTLPDGTPWQVELPEVAAVGSRYLEAYRKSEVVQTVWDTLRPAIVSQWCRTREECQQQRSIADGHAVCTTSYVCVPIVLGSQRLGVLSLEFPSTSEDLLGEYSRTMSVVAGWIAHDCLVRGLLPPEGPTCSPPPLPPPPPATLVRPEATSLRHQIRSMEREAIEKALAASGGNMSAAARQLGITPRMMRYKLKILKIPNVRPPRQRREPQP